MEIFDKLGMRLEIPEIRNKVTGLLVRESERIRQTSYSWKCVLTYS